MIIRQEHSNVGEVFSTEADCSIGDIGKISILDCCLKQYTMFPTLLPSCSAVGPEVCSVSRQGV